jgi:hypothetical protein
MHNSTKINKYDNASEWQNFDYLTDQVEFTNKYVLAKIYRSFGHKLQTAAYHYMEALYGLHNKISFKIKGNTVLSYASSKY